MKKKRKTVKKMKAEYDAKGRFICPDCKQQDKLKMQTYRSVGGGKVEFVYICQDCNVKVSDVKLYTELGA